MTESYKQITNNKAHWQYIPIMYIIYNGNILL